MVKKAFTGIAEIRRSYRAQWVLLGDPVTGDSLEIKRGAVLFHSSNRDEVYRKARELKPEHSAIIYTGEPAKDAVIIL